MTIAIAAVTVFFLTVVAILCVLWISFDEDQEDLRLAREAMKRNDTVPFHMGLGYDPRDGGLVGPGEPIDG